MFEKIVRVSVEIGEANLDQDFVYKLKVLVADNFSIFKNECSLHVKRRLNPEDEIPEYYDPRTKQFLGFDEMLKDRQIDLKKFGTILMTQVLGFDIPPLEEIQEPVKQQE